MNNGNSNAQEQRQKLDNAKKLVSQLDREAVAGLLKILRIAREAQGQGRQE